MRVMTLLPIALLLVSACSGESSPGSGGSDSGLGDAGSCEPAGDWTWTFQPEAGASKVDHVSIETAADAGPNALRVVFLDRQVPKDTCMPSDAGADAGPELIEATGTLDPASCTLTVGYSQSWCQSGEQQVESWDIALTLSGSSGQGTATAVSGWTMQKYTTTYTVTAAKDAP